jgi:hypothetical protein
MSVAGEKAIVVNPIAREMRTDRSGGRAQSDRKDACIKVRCLGRSAERQKREVSYVAV